MVKILEGPIKNKGKRFCIVVSRFNDFITKNLLGACLAELKRHGVKDGQITIAWVPGSFEIPVVALKFAQKKTIDCVICLGAVIKGETLHFDLIARGVARGVAQVPLLTGKPVIFGVLTTFTVDQADKRSQKKGNNKGRDAALAALEIVNLIDQI